MNAAIDPVLLSSAHTIRPIAPDEDIVVAAIIRTVMPEFGVVIPGEAAEDPEFDSMYASYSAPRSAYFVLERRGAIVGGAGIAPLRGGAFTTCELRKMYFLPSARGRGDGERLLRHCLRVARGFGFLGCYLETLKGMTRAQQLYDRMGFRSLPQPRGATGNFGCDRWYALWL